MKLLFFSGTWTETHLKGTFLALIVIGIVPMKQLLLTNSPTRKLIKKHIPYKYTLHTYMCTMRLRNGYNKEFNHVSLIINLPCSCFDLYAYSFLLIKSCFLMIMDKTHVNEIISLLINKIIFLYVYKSKFLFSYLSKHVYYSFIPIPIIRPIPIARLLHNLNINVKYTLLAFFNLHLHTKHWNSFKRLNKIMSKQKELNRDNKRKSDKIAENSGTDIDETNMDTSVNSSENGNVTVVDKLNSTFVDMDVKDKEISVYIYPVKFPEFVLDTEEQGRVLDLISECVMGKKGTAEQTKIIKTISMDGALRVIVGNRSTARWITDMLKAEKEDEIMTGFELPRRPKAFYKCNLRIRVRPTK